MLTNSIVDHTIAGKEIAAPTIYESQSLLQMLSNELLYKNFHAVPKFPSAATEPQYSSEFPLNKWEHEGSIYTYFVGRLEK